jgi:hypothetical protein
MKSKVLLAWLAIIVVATLAAAVTHWILCGGKMITQDNFSDTKFLAHKLSLTPAQTLAVGKQQEAFAAKLADCCARHCAARAQLATALASGTNADALIKTMGQAYEESERLMWAHIQHVRTLLTPAQQARYDALVERCLYSTCNMATVQHVDKCEE